MSEYRRFWLALVVLALISPLGLSLPDALKAGSAWGEWGVDEIRQRIGYVPLQVIGMTVRFMYAFQRQAEEIHLAKKSRSVCRAPIVSMQAWVGSRIAAAWERSLRLMEEVGEAMTARGFRGERRFPPGAGFGAAEWTLGAAVVAACAVAHLI